MLTGTALIIYNLLIITTEVVTLGFIFKNLKKRKL